MTKDISTVPTAEQIDKLLADCKLERLGMGSRRACYALPDGKLCIKCYRSDQEIAEGRDPAGKPFRPISNTVKREIPKRRHDERRNTSCQEYRYWRALNKKLPVNLMAAFPLVVGAMHLPQRGWCIIEERLTDFDGTPLEKFHVAWAAADAATKAKLLAAFDSLAEDLEHNSVRFYDPQNIMVQWCANGQFRLRITDFEPASRVGLPLDRLSPFFARMKLRRRFARYRAQYAIDERAAKRPGPIAGGQEQVNILCLKWGSYYEPKYVNRLYAGVKRNLKRPFRFVCVTDDPKGLNEGIETVPLPDNPQVGSDRKWPNIFVKLCLFKNGFANLVGPTLFLDIDLLITGPLDKFFDYRPGEFCIIHNWVERRKSLFRRKPLIGNSSCFRFDAGRSGDVYDTFIAEKNDTALPQRFELGSQKFQTYAMRKAGRVNWWPSGWVCSFKRQLVPIFPLNKIFAPWRPPKDASIVAFHGQPDVPQAREGYYLKYDKPVKPHLTCKPTAWIDEYWRE